MTPNNRYLVMFDNLKEQEQSSNSRRGEDNTMSELLQGIASITKTVQQTLNSYEVRKWGDKVQGYVMNFTETEQKVRDATNEDPWGPTGPQMQEIASLTFQYDGFSEVMGILWKRLFQENKLAWRRVYKSLILLNHLLKNGSERVINTARDHMFEMRALESYKCVDERGKDEGVNVRHRVKLILELLNDEELLRAERRKAKTEGREKYQGFSKEDMLGGRGSSNKIDSFESWNEKKNKNTNGDGGNERGFGGKREVTAFDFDSEPRSNNNGSPELGIRERTPEPSDDRVGDDADDDFGDFTSARATSKANTAAAPQNASSALFSAIRPPPAPLTATSSPAAKHGIVHSPPRAQSSAGGELDLLGLGTDFGAAAPAATFAPAQSAPCIASPPAQKNALLDDLFASPPPPPSPSAKEAASKHKNGGIGGNNDFIDLLSGSMLSVSNNNNNDLLGAGFGVGSNNGGFAEQKGTSSSIIVNNQKQKSDNEPNASIPAALGSTWQDLKGKVNIDFENLSLKPSPSKPTPSLNELKKQTPTNNDRKGDDFLF